MLGWFLSIFFRNSVVVSFALISFVSDFMVTLLKIIFYAFSKCLCWVKQNILVWSCCTAILVMVHETSFWGKYFCSCTRTRFWCLQTLSWVRLRTLITRMFQRRQMFFHLGMFLPRRTSNFLRTVFTFSLS